MQVRRRAERIPGDLRVEMRVDVDEAGRHDQTARVDLLAPGAVDLADRGDAIAGDGDVAFERRRAGAVDDGAAANDEIGFHRLSSWFERDDASRSPPCRTSPGGRRAVGAGAWGGAASRARRRRRGALQS